MLPLLEQGLRDVLGLYTKEKIKGASSSTLLREVSAFVARVGKAAPKLKGIEAATTSLGKFEQKLRENIKVAPLPPPVFTPPSEDEPRKVRGPKQASLVPDESPAVQVNESGDVVQDNVMKLREAGIMQGTTVTLKRQTRGVKRGAVGVVESVSGSEPIVKWRRGSFADGRDKDQACGEGVATTVASLQVATAESEQIAPRRENPRTPDLAELPDGEPWVHYKDEQAAEHIAQIAHANLFQAYITSSPSHDKVILLRDPFRIMAREDIKAGGFAFFPYSPSFARGNVQGNHTAAVFLAMQGSHETRFYFTKPRERSEKNEDEGESPQAIMFWALRDSTASEGEPIYKMATKEAVMNMPVAGFAMEKPRLPSVRKTSMTLKFEYYTNVSDVPRGAVLVS